MGHAALRTKTAAMLKLSLELTGADCMHSALLETGDMTDVRLCQKELPCSALRPPWVSSNLFCSLAGMPAE